MILPAGCVACRDWIPGGEDAPLVCGRCRSRLRRLPWPRCDRCHHPVGTGRVALSDCRECREWPAELTLARCAFAHRSPADDLVHGLKYEGWSGLADFMAESMAAVLTRELRPVRDAVLVPVPTTIRRIRRRGYNQASLLAERLALRWRLPCREALLRAGASTSQTTLAPGQRRENVRGAFVPAPAGSEGVAGRRVILVDDVLTTGSTASEAARVLAAMGAASVTATTFARALVI